MLDIVLQLGSSLIAELHCDRPVSCCCTWHSSSVIIVRAYWVQQLIGHIAEPFLAGIDKIRPEGSGAVAEEVGLVLFMVRDNQDVAEFVCEATLGAGSGIPSSFFGRRRLRDGGAPSRRMLNPGVDAVRPVAD